LLVFIAAAFLGTLQIGLLDPLPLLARSIGTAVLPTLHTASKGIVGWISSIGYPPLGVFAQKVYDQVAPYLLPYRQMHFHTILTIGLFFALILILNRVFARFWCRGICPLGAMLGIFSRYAIFGLKKDETTCNHCNECLMHCQGADNPDIGSRWRQSECHLCLNCQAACPNKSLSFQFFPEQENTSANPAGTPKVDITRRKVLASLAGGLALFPLLRSGDAFKVNPDSRLIRPPGAVGEALFLAKCIRCGQCMRVCPNNALHPTLFESGMEGVWSPLLIARIGYCEPTCTLCGQVCPTGAIMPLTVREKVGDEDISPVRIGTAFIDRGRCIPWAMGKTCIVCEEWCPTAIKAVYFHEEDFVDRSGRTLRLKRPYIDLAQCTGCGACEFACPVVDRPAVYVTAIGESRSAENQILLERHRAASSGAGRR